MVHKQQRRRDYFVSTTDNYYNGDNDENEVPKSYCTVCESYGFPYNLLGPRIYPKDELINGQKPSDWESWLMCKHGHITFIGHAKQDSELAPVKEPDSNIYDSRKVTIEHFVPSRRTNTNRKVNRVIRENPETDDPDVKPKVESGSRLVSYETSDR